MDDKEEGFGVCESFFFFFFFFFSFSFFLFWKLFSF
jgi:hypothetical protein